LLSNEIGGYNAAARKPRSFTMMRCTRPLPALSFLTILAPLLATVSTSSGQTLSLQPVVTTGLSQPLYLTAPPGDNNRLFILEKGGAIRLFNRQTNTLQTAPYLAIPVSSDGERGLLGMAFDPGFATNGRFYINYTAPAGPNLGDQIIARYQANGDPMTATSASPTGFELLRLDRPSATTSNHNGGWIGFSPNNPNNLYIAVGDGGGSNDTFSTAQNTNSPHGKMLRIDVNNPGFLPYGIPADNPFVAGGGRPEIWALGLRNPWRDSFDRATGNLWIGDVGQGAREEIDFQPAGAGGGLNYGWAFREGDIAGPKAPPSPIPGTGVVNPIHAYGRSLGASITGGYVYRGGIASLQGTYFYGDFISGRNWTLQYDGTTLTGPVERTSQLNIGPGNLASYGEDASGELYMIGLSGGDVFRIVPEPSSVALLVTGAIGLAMLTRRRAGRSRAVRKVVG